MSNAEKSVGETDGLDLNGAVTQAIGECGGDLLATVRSLVVANSFLMTRVQELDEDNERLRQTTSAGYIRHQQNYIEWLKRLP